MRASRLRYTNGSSTENLFVSCMQESRLRYTNDPLILAADSLSNDDFVAALRARSCGGTRDRTVAAGGRINTLGANTSSAVEGGGNSMLGAGVRGVGAGAGGPWDAADHAPMLL